MSAMQATALRSWSSAQQAALVDAVRQAVGQWCFAWDGPDIEAVQVEGPPWVLSAPEYWVPLGTHIDAAEGGWLGWVDASPDVVVQQLLYGKDALSDAAEMAMAVSHAAWRDLYHVICRVCSAPSERLPLEPPSVVSAGRLPAAHDWTWSGALRIRLSFADGMTACLQLGAGLVAACVPPASRTAMYRTATVPLTEALAAQRLRLQVCLAPVSLALGDLASLRPGNVIPLLHSLQQPLMVQDAAHQPLCHAHLGAVHGRKAVVVLPFSNSEES